MMANILTTLGHDPVGMKRATETALRQVSGEIDRLEARIVAIEAILVATGAAIAAQQAILDDHEARIVALEP